MLAPTSAVVPSSYPNQTGAAYPTNIDGNAIAGLRAWGQFAPRPQQTPNMTLQIDPGAVPSGSSLTENGTWTVGTLNSSTSTTVTGSTQGIAVGQEVQGWLYIGGVLTPAYPNDTFVTAVAGTTITTNNAALITDSGVTLVFGQGVGIICNGNTHTSTTIDTLPNGATDNVFVGMLVAGSGVPNGATVSTVNANSVVISNATTTTLTATPITFSIPAPAANPRIDRIAYNQNTGAVAWLKGTESATPVPPGITNGYSPICQLALTTATTAITATSVIGDERLSANASGGPTFIASTLAPFLRGFLDGFEAGAPGGASVLTIGPGSCVDATNSLFITQTSSFTKTTSAWVQGSGNGGLDTGAIAASTAYFVYAIQKTDGSANDYLFSLSNSGPTMPSGWTVKRIIGWFITDGSSHIFQHQWRADECIYGSPFHDINGVTLPTGSRTLYTLTVPLGFALDVLFRTLANNVTTANTSYLFTSPDEADIAAGTNNSTDSYIIGATNGQIVAGNFVRRCNTSGQIGGRASGAGSLLDANTYGFIWTRGRNS